MEQGYGNGEIECLILTNGFQTRSSAVPVSFIELSSQIVLHKLNSPAWLKHIQNANAALGSLSPERMANLRPGEDVVWSSKAIKLSFCIERLIFSIKRSLSPFHLITLSLLRANLSTDVTTTGEDSSVRCTGRGPSPVTPR
jgi:hypothetical protein